MNLHHNACTDSLSVTGFRSKASNCNYKLHDIVAPSLALSAHAKFCNTCVHSKARATVHTDTPYASSPPRSGTTQHRYLAPTRRPGPYSTAMKMRPKTKSAMKTLITIARSEDILFR